MIQKIKQLAAGETQRKVLGDIASPSFSNPVQDTFRQRLLAQPEKPEKTQWYRGEAPTTSEALARIFTISLESPATGKALFESFTRFSSDASSPLYNPYTQPTSQAAKELASLGYDTSGGITADWLSQNAGLMNSYRTGTSGSPLAPSSASTAENDAAYWYYKALDSEETTLKAETEWGALQEELRYWVGRSDRNYSDDEILGKIDWSMYPTLAKMDESAAKGTPLALNRSVGYSKDALPGVLWAARNNGGTGNPLYDSVSAALGRGSGWSENPEITAKLDPTSPEYNPYAVSGTLDEEALYFGVSSFDESWLDANRGYISGTDATAKSYYKSVYQAEQTTARAEAELAALEAELAHLKKYSSTPEAILDALEYDFKDKYPTLAKMDESLKSGSLLSTTRAVNYRWSDIVDQVNEHCEGYNDAAPGVDYAKGILGSLQAASLTGIQVDTFKAISDAEDAAIEDAALVVGTHGTSEEKVVFETAYTAAFDTCMRAINHGISNGALSAVGSYDQMIGRANEYAAENYLGILEAVIPYETAQADLAEAEAEIAELESRYPWLLNPQLKDAVLGAPIPQALNNQVAARYAKALRKADDARAIVESGAAAYADAQERRANLQAGYDAASRFSALAGAESGDTSILNMMDFVFQYGREYTPTNWSPTTVYDTYDTEMGSGAGTVAATAALTSIPREIARIDDVIRQLEAQGVSLDGTYKSNLERWKAALQRELKDAQYYLLQNEEDFAEAAQRGREAWYRSPESARADAWYYHLTTPDQLGVQMADPSKAYYAAMTDVEKQTLFYLYETQGRAAAGAYFDHLTDSSYGRLTVRDSMNTSAEFAALAEEAPVAMSVLSVFMSPMQAEGTIYSLGAKIMGNEINPYHHSFTATNAVGTTRETVKAGIAGAFGADSNAAAVANFFYDAVMAAGDSTVNAAMFTPAGGLGSLAGSSYMGFTAAGSAMQDVKLRGGTDEQALLMGGVTMVTETLSEHITIGNIKSAFGKGASATRGFLKELAANAGEEAFGEAVNEFITSVSDTAIMGALSKCETRIDAYVEAGMTPEDAERRATLDTISDILYAGALGATSSTVSTSTSYASGYTSYILGREKSTPADVKTEDAVEPENPDVTTVPETQPEESTPADVKTEDAVEPENPDVTTVPEVPQEESPSGDVNSQEYGDFAEPIVIDENSQPTYEASPITRNNTEIQPTVDTVLQGQPMSAPVESDPFPESIVIDENSQPTYEASPITRNNTEMQPTVDTALLGRQMSALAEAQNTPDEASQTATVAAVLAPTSENEQADDVASTAAQHMAAEYGSAKSATTVSDVLMVAAENGIPSEAVTVAVSTAALAEGESHNVLTEIAEQGATSDNIQRLIEAAREAMADPNMRGGIDNKVRENRIAQRTKHLIAEGGLSGLASYQSAVTQARANVAKARQQLQQAQEAQSVAGQNLQSTTAQMLENPSDAAMRGAVQQAVKDVEGAVIVTQQMEQSVEKYEGQLREAETALESVTQSTLKKLREQAVQEIAAEEEQAAQAAAAQAQAEAEAAARARANLEADATARHISLTNKTTGAATSNEMLHALTTLASGGTLTLDDIQMLPEVRDAYAMVGDVRAQVEQYSPVWESEVPAVIAELSELGSATKGANGKVQYTGPVAQNRRLDIVIGLPAAGKSSVLADPLSEKHQSRIIDSDMAKERLSGYRDGLGAGVVHEASGVVKEAVLEKALERGDNIVLPIIGSDADKLRTLINDYKAAGYSVHLHLNELAAGKAIGRALNRYLAQGRFIDPRFLFNYGNKPSAVYDQLITEEGLLDGHSKYSNDVDLGQEPIFLGGSENLSSVRGTDEPGGRLESERGSEVPGPEGTGTEEQRSDEPAGRVKTIQAKKGPSSTSAPAGISTDATGKPKFSPHRIAKDLTKALGIGGDIGTRKMNRLPDRVLGYYEQRAKYIAVRSSQAGNYVTTMHEIGHAIADRLRMTGTSDMVTKLDPVFASSYTPAELPGEAFAEFMWRYMESDTRGRSFAGDTFVDMFEQRLRGAGLYRDVKDAQKNLQIWINANTNDQIGATVVNQSDANKKSWGQRFRSLLSEMVDSTAALNSADNAIRDANKGSIPVGESIRQQALLKNTAAQRAFNILHKGLTDSRWSVIGKSLADRFSEAGLTAKDADLLNRYALALHSLDRDAQGKPVFDDHITPEAREAFIRDVETNHPEVVAAEKAWQEFRTEFLQAMMVDTGYMTQGTLDLFNKMYPHYVPTMRVKEGQTHGDRSGTYTVRRATGSTEDIINPMDSFVRMIDSVVTMVSANNAALAWDAAYNKYEGMGHFGRLITADTVTHTVDTTELNEAVRDLLEGNTDEDIMDQVLDLIGRRQSQVKNTGTSTDPGTLQVQLPNGTRRLYKIFDPDMFTALASAQNGTYQFGLWAPLAWATRAMSALTTGSNPIFGARNFLRDFQSSVNYGSWASNYATGAAKWMRAAYDVWAQKGEYKDYMALGGGGWTQIYAGKQKSADEYRAALYKGYNTGNVGRTVKYAGKKLWETVTLAKLNEVIEQTSRYAEYKYGKHDKSTAEGRQAAFLAGQDATTDFHRRGGSQGVATLKAVIPFFNASLQGVYRTGRMYTEQGERGRLPQRFAKTVLNTALASALGAGLLLRFLDDDEREEFEWLSNDLKSQHIYIPNFAPSIFGEQPLIRIPLAQDPLSYAVHNAVTNAVWGGDESVIDLMSTVDTILDNLNPLGDPITQAWNDTLANRTWYGSKIVPTRMESWDATLQYTEETPELFITLGRVTGQSPLKLQYLAEQYTGFVGQMAIPALSYDTTGELGGIEAAVNSARKKLTSDPLVSNDIISAFYDGSNLMDTVIAAVKNDRPLNMLRYGLTFEEGQQAYEEAYAMTHKGGIIYEVSNYISDTYAAIDAINARTDLTDEEKYELTSAQRREMIEAALDANEAVQAYREKYITGKGLTSLLFEGTYTEPMSAFQRLPAVFANAADERYMKNAKATWEATGNDSALPHPNTSFSAGKVEYVIGEADWDQWCSWYNEAYRLHLSKYEIGWEALSPEEQLDILKEAHTKAHNYCKSQYLAK